MDFIFLVIEGCLGLFVLLQGYAVLRFLLTNGVTAGVVLSAMMIAVGVVLVATPLASVSKWLTLSSAIIVGVILALLCRRHLSRFALLETAANRMIDRNHGRRVRFDDTQGIPYFPNSLVLFVFVGNYLITDSQLSHAISKLGIILFVPIFAIKLISERRF